MKIKEKEQKVEDEFSLSVYLMTLRSLHPGATSYKDQAALMHEEFGIEVSENDLYELEQGEYEIPEENKYGLIYKNML
jgi:hypothetical protein